MLDVLFGNSMEPLGGMNDNLKTFWKTQRQILNIAPRNSFAEKEINKVDAILIGHSCFVKIVFEDARDVWRQSKEGFSFVDVTPFTMFNPVHNRFERSRESVDNEEKNRRA